MSEWLEEFIEKELEGKEKPINRCELCDVYYSSEYCRIEHLNGKRHKTALLGEEIMREPSCKICKIEYQSVEHRNQHLSGKLHHSNRNGKWSLTQK